MSSFDDLLRRLDAVEAADWEDEYARTAVELTRNQAIEVVRSERVYAEWFMFRFEAGPPGVPLPTIQAALEAILSRYQGTALDAYRVVFASPIPNDVPVELPLALLCNATGCALKRGTSWFALWLAARAGLAAIALGAPERAWLFLDSLTTDGRRHPHLDKLAIFEPLRCSEIAQRSPWVQATICWLWPAFGVPSVPVLPFPEFSGGEASLSETLDELTRIGASEVENFVRAYAKERDRAYMEQYSAEPLVRDLHARVMEGRPEPPNVDGVPQWFIGWARAVARTGEVELARLAGLVLHDADATDDRMLIATLVLPAARASDLDVLIKGFDATELQPLFVELAKAQEALPSEVADALVAAALPHHIRHIEAFPFIAQHIELLLDLEVTPQGFIEHMRTIVQTLAEERLQDLEAARPLLERLVIEVNREASRLSTLNKRLDLTDIERFITTTDVPDITTGLLEAAIEEVDERPPLNNLLLLLVLRRAVGETDHAAEWMALLAKEASDAIYAFGEPGLFELRLHLLDEAIEAEHVLLSRSELHFQRANTRRATQPRDERETELVLHDMNLARRLARTEGSPSLCAAATAAWVKFLVWKATTFGGDHDDLFDDAQTALIEALDLPLTPFNQALLHQARAHLLRFRSPADSLSAFETALDLLTPDVDLWAEIAAEIVVILRRVDRIEEAVKRGTQYLNAFAGDKATDGGMLHLTLGEALGASRHWDDAQRQLEHALQLLRGHDPHNETITRLQLAHLGLAAGNKALIEEHLRFLQDHKEELDPLARRDLDLLEAAVYAAGGDTTQHRDALVRTLSTVKEERARVGLRLEIARLDREQGRPVHNLESLIMEGIKANLDGHYDAVLTDLLCNHEEAWAASTYEEALHWAQRRGPSIVARLQHQAGQAEAAHTTLRDALNGDLDDHQRLICAHKLMLLLDHEDHHERLALCSEIERLLDVEDEPYIRLNLAACLGMSADNDLGLVRRARAHALQANAAHLNADARRSCHNTIGQATVDLIRLSQPLSSPDLAYDASWLLEDLALTELDASRLRTFAAQWLLLPGPLAHPEAVSIAGSLLELVTAPSYAQHRTTLCERLRQIQDGFTTLANPMRAELRGPCDAIPSWLVHHVQGGGGNVDPEALVQDVSVFGVVIQVRPDVIDSLTAMAISVQHKLAAKSRQDLLFAVYSMVQSNCEAVNANWPCLRRALDGVQKKDSHPVLLNILSAINRSSHQTIPSQTKANEPTSAQVDSWQRALDCFERSTTLMDSLQLDPYAADARQRIAESRALLDEAVNIARKEQMPGLFDFIVSYGNSWKRRPDEDIEKALCLYEDAAKLDASPEQKAKLWKVHADALLLRGSDDDLRRADQLLDEACLIRRGLWLAETLLSRAQVALVHPDLDEVARQRKAANFIMDAVKANRDFGEQDGVVKFLLHILSMWEQKQPNDPTPMRIRDAFKLIYPARAAQVDASVPRATNRDRESIIAMLNHPAGQAFVKVSRRLATASELNRDPLGLLDQFGPSAREAIAKHMEHSLLGHSDRAEDVLSSLIAAPDDAASPGRLAARVILLAHLARIGRRTVNEVRLATTEAIDASGEVENFLVRSVLLREIAVAWSPADHAEDPVCDFALSANLLRRCVEIEGGEDNTVGDVLALLARALRYSPAGDIQANLREARRLYMLRLERGRATDSTDVIAHLMHNLADVESQMGTGSRLERKRAAEQRLEDTIAKTQSPANKAQFTANLAWERTQIGSMIPGAEGVRYLKMALATFDDVDPTLLDEHAKRNVENNRCVCKATLARLIDGSHAEIACWREYLASLDDSVAPYSVATAKHNLANALIFHGEVTRESLTEGLELLRDAAHVRTREANARHHWETSLNLGRALLGQLIWGRDDLLTSSPNQVATEAALWLRSAVAAARDLGPGEELLDAAFELVGLANCASTPKRFIEVAEEAWADVRQASAYLLFDAQSREREAWTATATAAQLAYRLADRSIAAQSPGLAFVLHGESAQLVERWIVRAQQPARRPLQARLSRPKVVSMSTWETWRNAVSSRDQRQLADALDRVREAAPTFLAEDHANDVTWRWLAARPGSVAVSIVLAQPAALALLMHTDNTGVRKTWVLGLELEPVPHPFDALAGLMRGAVPEANAHAVLDDFAQWVRRVLVDPILRFLDAPPSVVLWSPGPDLRLVAPSAIWLNIPVVSTTSLVLPDLTSAPSRRRSSLVVLADPGAESSDPQLDLRAQGLPALESLERAAAQRGPVRLLSSVGKRFGRALLGERSMVRDTPASARNVLLEVAEHESIIIIAHGEVETLEGAAMLCLDESGKIDRLDVAQLGQAPEAFAGATVLLLSCEGGRMGSSMVDPGGLAGTLLAAGAACVVAPLWPVRLDAAEQVGRAVLDGMASGDEPWTALAKLHVHGHHDSPMLGRPAPSLSERRAEQALQRLAFVVWIG